MTSSSTNTGGKSIITVQFLKSRLISCKRAPIDRDAIHSDELSVAAAAVDKIESWITDYLTE